MAVRVRPSRRLRREDLPTLGRPENATCRSPLTGSGWAWPIWPMAPANSTDLMRIRVESHGAVRAASSAGVLVVEEGAHPVGEGAGIGVAAGERLHQAGVRAAALGFLQQPADQEGERRGRRLAVLLRQLGRRAHVPLAQVALGLAAQRRLLAVHEGVQPGDRHLHLRRHLAQRRARHGALRGVADGLHGRPAGRRHSAPPRRPPGPFSLFTTRWGTLERLPARPRLYKSAPNRPFAHFVYFRRGNTGIPPHRPSVPLRASFDPWPKSPAKKPRSRRDLSPRLRLSLRSSASLRETAVASAEDHATLPSSCAARRRG